MTLRWTVVLAALTGALSHLTLAGPASDVVWEGQIVREISTTEFAVHERRGLTLRNPDWDREAPTEATETVTFPSVFRIDVEVTRRATDDDGFAMPTTVSPLGTIFVATHVAPEAARAAVREVVRGLQILSPQNLRFPMPQESGRSRPIFSHPGSPFYADPATWICFEPADGPAAIEHLVAHPFAAPGGGTGIRSSGRVEMPARNAGLCRQLREAFAESSAAESYASRPAIETTGRQALSLSVHRPGAGKARVPLPDGVALKTERDESHGGTKSTSHSSVVDFPLSIARSTSVVMRWTLGRPLPEERSAGGATRAEAVPSGDWILAIYPPMSERPAGDIQPDLAEWEEGLVRRVETDFRKWIGEKFQGSTRLPPDEVEAVVRANLPDLLRSEHALVVGCREDDSGTYETYPTGHRTAIKNAAVFCPELRRALESP